MDAALCRNNQEILDTVIQAYRIAEEVYIPVMVCYDGFVLSHTMMPVEIPDAEAVKSFLPPYKPHAVLSPDDPKDFNPVIFPGRRENSKGVLCDGYMEIRYKLQCGLEEIARDDRGRKRFLCPDIRQESRRNALGVQDGRRRSYIDGNGIDCQRGNRCGRYAARRGTQGGRGRDPLIQTLSQNGVRQAFGNAKAVVVLQKSISYGYEGGLCSELKSAFYGTGIDAPVYDIVLGLGGRDVKAGELVEAGKKAMADLAAGIRERPTEWLNCYTGDD